MVIIVDGPAASGKSTLAWYLANLLRKMGVEKVHVIDEHLDPAIADKLQTTPRHVLVKMLNEFNDEGVTFVTRPRYHGDNFPHVAARASGRPVKEESMYTIKCPRTQRRR